MDLAEQRRPRGVAPHRWIASSRSSPTAFTASRARSTSTPATASWRCSVRRSRTKTMRRARCHAALALCESLRAILRHELRLDARARASPCALGLNSGEVVVGKIGDDLRMDYTAQGHTVGLAARMEQLAEPRTASTVTEHTARLVAGYFAASRPRSSNQIKGLQRAAAASSSSKASARACARASTCHAHAASLAIRRAPAASVRARGVALTPAVAGRAQRRRWRREAGTGKSRLCSRVPRRAAAHASVCVSRRTASRTARRAAAPRASELIAQLLRHQPRARRRRPRSATQDRRHACTARSDTFQRCCCRWCSSFMGIGDSIMAVAPRSDPESRQRQTRALMARHTGCAQPRCGAAWCSWIEEFPLVDGAERGVCHRPGGGCARTRTLLLVNFRPEYDSAWLEGPHCRVIALAPLAPTRRPSCRVRSARRRASPRALAERIETTRAATRSFSRRSCCRWRRPGRFAAAAARTASLGNSDAAAPDRLGRARRADRPLRGAREGGAADGRGDRQ